jgi:hypothetical protein
MNTNETRLHHLLHGARTAKQPDVHAPPFLTARVLANLRDLPVTDQQNLQQTLVYGVAIAASITLLLLLAPDAFPSLTPVSEPESIAHLFIDLSDL